jgi:hypothetical protein
MSEQEHLEWCEANPEAINDMEEQQRWAEYEQDMEETPKLMQISERQPITKDRVLSDLAKAQRWLDDGMLNPLDLVAYSKYLEEIAKGFNDMANDMALDLVSSKETHLGVVLEKRETGVRYDFSGSPKWEELKEAEKEAANERKRFEQVVKAYDGIGSVTYDDEVCDIVPPVKTSTTKLVRTLK